MKLHSFLESKVIKLLLLLSIFILGALSLYYGFRGILFLEQYHPSDTSVTGTSQFSSLYQQYVDRAAVYTKYREAGYEPDPSSFYAKTDLISMFNGKLAGNLIPTGSVYLMNQESFEYYNYLLNVHNPDFFYYVVNETANTFYYNESLSGFIREVEHLSAQEPITLEVLDHFYESFIKANCPYLVLNSAYGMYYTNITSNGYSGISEDSMKFATNYLTSKKTDFQITMPSDHSVLLDNGQSITQAQLTLIRTYLDSWISNRFGSLSADCFSETEYMRRESAILFMLRSIPQFCLDEMLSVAGDYASTKVLIPLSDKSEVLLEPMLETTYLLFFSFSEEPFDSSETINYSITETQEALEQAETSVVNNDGSNTTPGYLLYTGYLQTAEEQSSVFLDLKHNFNYYYKDYKLMFHVLPWSFGGLLFLLILSVFAIGHKKGVKGIYQNIFDHIPYEFLLFAIGGCFLGCFYWFSVLKNQFGLIKAVQEPQNPFQLPLWASLIYLILFSVLAVFFVTTIRRIKSYTWISSFFCLRFLYFLLRKVKHVAQTFFHSLLRLFRQLFTDKSTAFQVVLWLFLFCCYLGLALLVSYLWNSFALCIILVFLGVAIYGTFLLRAAGNLNVIRQVTRQITSGELNAKAPLPKSLLFRELTENINHIGNGLAVAVEQQLKSERMKTELITNVSHDIKTPLTSIINYVNLLKKTGLQEETTQAYLAVLEEKSWRLKTLIEDLVEASKASSGTLAIQLQRLDLCELVKQACGEFEDRLEDRDLELVLTLSENSESEEGLPVIADGRSTYRIIENLLSNVIKYAMPGTRVYVETCSNPTTALLSIKNISAAPLNISSDELMERFVRGDLSRNTEGSGLGLSIAKSLAELQHGSFELYLDGDLFKAIVTLPLYFGSPD